MSLNCITAKIVLVGNPDVGKTSLVLKFIDKHFNHMVSPTIGATFFRCCLHVNDSIVNLQIWDTAGQERFRSMVPMYYRNISAAFIVFDITKHYTFTVAKYWVTELVLKQDGPIVCTLIGNKKDLSKDRTVSKDEANEFAKTFGAFYYEVSALEFQGVNEIFINTAKEILKLKSCENSTAGTTNDTDSIKIDEDSKNQSSRSFCCYMSN